MSDLFTAPSTPQAQAPARDPRIHICTSCGRENAPCGMNGLWYCPGCAPPTYGPRTEDEP